MSHVFENKKKIVARLRRIKGQLEAVERSLEAGDDCFLVLQTLSACRGGMNGLMGELLEGHVKEHIVKNTQKPTSSQDKAALSLVKLLKTYWK
ncbi:MAG: metal/formaldehyde-sensitive transcriptional repressor [Bacteriovoracaceae bacterium]|nr:metal/formaldehyde-sensitive transcriptional repressor [Bacteriovoracaceae bacterium]